MMINDWLEKENQLGSTNADRVVLATATREGVPHSRIVAIREISEEGILFFTQSGSRKVAELTENPVASMTLWLAMQQRQVILEGYVKPLKQEENQHYWDLLPRERQLRFTTHGPFSGQPISSLLMLEELCAETAKKFHESARIPLSECYRGFRLKPESILFYTLGTETFSDVVKYTFSQGAWISQILSP